MTVLRRIQIKNFRSIKSLDIDTNYLTLLVGQNDAGKSNILRALNLFFNGETNPNAPFFFEEDNYALNNPNRKAPRIEISIEIELPQNYQRTNGERVVWTKKWRHFGLESSEYYGVRITQNRLGNEVREKVNIPDKSNAHALLRQINFIYVPAIKDTLYFERLRGAIYQLISDVGAQTFKESSSNFEGSIAEHLVDLTSSISAKLGFETNLALPKDLTHIFERLDFLGGDHTISLNNRGDGIKARHIPIILKFLAEQKKNTQTRGGQPYTFIWGYEEPENNVEMSRCFEMADEFWDYMNNDVAQVLITTHSPVFYSLTDKNEDGAEWATRHHIFLNSVKEGTQTTSDPADLDDRMGITRLMAPYIKIERQKFEARTRAKYEAERLAEDNRLPIYVEGPSDNTVITKAIEVFAPHILDRVSVQNAEESGGTEYVKNMLIAWDRKMKHETNRRRAYGLFDDDKAGQDDKKETELHIQTNGQKRVSFSSKLNVPVALRSLRNRFQMPIPITLEAYYPIEVWNAANERGWLESRDVRKIITPNQMNNCIDGQSLEEQLGEHYHPIIKSEFMLSRKNSAAQYVTRMDNIETVLADFQPIIRKISETLFHEEEHPWQQEAAE